MEQKKNEESPFLSTPLFLSPKVNTSNESSLVSGFGTEKTTNIFDQNFRNKNENPFNIISRKENPFETNVFSETKFNLPQSASIDAFNTGKQTLPLFSFGKVSSVEKMSKEFENTGEAMKNKFAGMTSGFPFKFEPAEEKLKDEKSKLSRKAEWNKMERLPKLREEEVEEERGEEKKLQINLLNSEKFQAADKAKEENEKVISKSETLLEKSRQEMEMREKEKRETEERLKKQEEARLEMENRKRREESARLEKLKQIQVRQKIEEKKQKEESEYK